MNYIDYANQFWKENCRKRFQSRETALFFFLLNECSRNYWVMPVICSTEYVCCQLLISKQTLYAARNSLAERGLICFNEGKWGTQSPSYSILELSENRINGICERTNVGTNNNTKECANGIPNIETNGCSNERTKVRTTIIKEQTRPYEYRQDNNMSSTPNRSENEGLQKYRNINGQWK